MNPELKTSDYIDSSAPEMVADVDDIAEIEVTTAEPAPLVVQPHQQSQSSEQWRQIGERVSHYLGQLPELLSDFFSQYQRPLITLGLLFGGIVTVKLTLAILDAINDIPLLAPTFELVGIGYSAWFVYRYLLKVENRQELSQEIDALKQQVIGAQK
uniref:CAAD domain-containing protein n=1 Tax=Trichocoleus desertorum TaxID=1481672 RepID=UPI0025B35B83|nr:CAAD domain-containing protein [Trichocoleus desertorum]